MGWKPIVTLEEGLTRTVEFIRHHQRLLGDHGYGV